MPAPRCGITTCSIERLTRPDFHRLDHRIVDYSIWAVPSFVPKIREERWHELNAHPLWLFHGDRFPARAELHAQRNRVIGRHPETTFICAHLANDGEDLAEVGRWLDTYPNMVVEFGARISELGRQPYSARRFLIRYQDRVLFGSDTPPDRAAYRLYYCFLETDDEYFDPSASHHRQGFWMIYGIFLPRGVLEKVAWFKVR